MLSQAAQVADITYLVFVTGGLSAAAMISLAIDRASSVGFVVPAVTPLLVFIALQGGELYLGMSAMMLLFLVFVVLTSTRIERTLHENYRLRTKAVEDEARFRSMLEHSPVATCMTDVETGKVLFANQSYARLMRLPLDSLLHAEPARLFADPDAYAALRSRLASGEEISDHLLEIAASGVQQWVLATFLRTQYHDKPANLMWFYDITDRKRSEEAVQHLAYHDTLTDLPNRILLNESLDRALLAAEREGTSLAVLFIDLDKFKPVNDAFGHAAGDALLQQVSQRLLDCVRKSDFIARVGGDEFVVLLHALQSIADATVTAEKIVEALQRPFVVDGRELHIAASIGVALYPQHAHNSGDLMQFADVAMYYAKLDDEAAVRVYTPGMASGAENISRNEREH
ncbi:sensor domain-containing diguanylate cyclase [Acidihalobacter ferrooxydans]|uniref:sensor domain-containing diguanylate cyclase n=1 Tax=Acidihalobacter ferrooxydans TaxID=1765967 RepID=UPI0012EC862C|nr:sensor domain-containing diguanylate cyclase [Acidihalobacter ferrooxydans]